MHDVTEQLHEWSQSLAESIPPTDIDRITSPTTTTTESHATRRWLAVAASAIVVAGGILAIATLGNDDPDRIGPATNPTPVATDDATTTIGSSIPPSSTPGVAPVPQSTTPTTSTDPTTVTNPEDRLAAWPAPPVDLIHVDDIPRLLPTAAIPATVEPVRAAAEGGSAAPATFTQIFADAERDMLLTLQTQPAGTESTPTEMRQPVTIEGWDDAFLTDGSLRLVASDPSGFVRLTGTGIDSDEAVEIVATMQRRADGTPGWDLSGVAGGLVEINGAWNDSAAQRFLTWFDGDRVVAQMLTSPAYTDLIAQAIGNSFEKVDIGAAEGWLNPNVDRRSIVWSPDGTTIVVLGVADDSIDPLVIARSVDEFGVAEYESATTTEIPAGVGDGCDGSLFC